MAPPKREPIRVGAKELESKLLVKVNPVLPEKARQERVSGMVILQVVVNEEGEAYEVKVLRGYPLLDDAAVEAVRQVRGPQIPAVENELMRTRVISPGRRGGEPVPVAFIVEVAVP